MVRVVVHAIVTGLIRALDSTAYDFRLALVIAHLLFHHTCIPETGRQRHDQLFFS